LDPDISVANARIQAKRVAAARGIPELQVLTLVDKQTQGPQFGVLGYPRLNVLEVNLALDNLALHTSGK
jgi:K+-transporting ATPase ATPase C chain